MAGIIEQLANFVVRSLREVLIPPPDPTEIFGRHHGDKLIHLVSDRWI